MSKMTLPEITTPATLTMATDRTVTTDYLIKMTISNLDLLILREQIKQAESDLPPSFSRQRQLEQWISARNILAEQR